MHKIFNCENCYNTKTIAINPPDRQSKKLPPGWTSKKVQQVFVSKTIYFCHECSRKECSECKYRNNGPSHNGSKNCESGSIASGGDKSHCSCDVCF
jgi:hypothetical protein